METIRVAIADDHVLVRSGIRRLLELAPGMRVVGEAGSGPEAVELVGREHPDVLILDLQMPRGGGLDAMAPIREAAPRTRILVLTMHEDALHLRASLASGALGYVMKSAPAAELLSAVRDVFADRPHLDPDVKQLMQAAGDGPAAPGDMKLSQRERQVLVGLARGHTNREIGEQLGVGVKSIESYRSRLRAKLKARTRADLVQAAIRAGMLQGTPVGT